MVSLKLRLIVRRLTLLRLTPIWERYYTPIGLGIPIKIEAIEGMVSHVAHNDCGESQ